MPIFMKGVVKPTTRSLCKDIVSDPTAMSASFLVSSPTIPFQLPFEPRTNENRQELNATETSEFRY